MKAPLKATGTLTVWTTSKWRDYGWVIDLIERGETAEALDALSFINQDMSDTAEWAEVGTAEVTVTFHPREDAATKELDGLKAQLQKVRAENHMRENAILDRISKLQAIGCSVEVAQV